MIRFATSRFVSWGTIGVYPIFFPYPICVPFSELGSSVFFLGLSVLVLGLWDFPQILVPTFGTGFDSLPLSQNWNCVAF